MRIAAAHGVAETEKDAADEHDAEEDAEQRADAQGQIGVRSGFFAIGFVMLAALFAATSAMVSRAEDIGSVTTPVTMLVMIPYFLVIFFNDNPTVLAIMSYVPFSAPVGMPMRLFLGEAQWWEPLLALAVMLAACIGAILLGAKIYENSLLRMGARVKLREALSR